MTPAMLALLDRIDPDRTRTAGLDARLDDRAASRLAARLIFHGRPAPPPADALLAAIADLHRRDGDGDTVASDEWRSVRAAGVALAAAADRAFRPAAALAEAAAWPVANNRSGLTDIVDALAAAAQSVAVAATGWTIDDGLRAEATLRRIVADHPGAARATIPPRFAAIDPVLERRFVAQLEAANTMYLAFTDIVLAALLAAVDNTELPA